MVDIRLAVITMGLVKMRLIIIKLIKKKVSKNI